MNDYNFPSIDLLNKNTGAFLPLGKITFKKDLKNKLLVPIGKDNEKEVYYMDFNFISTLFICGTTGSGKSIFIDSLVISLLLKNSPKDINFIFFDPKIVELSEYDGIPHILYSNDDNQLKTDSLGFLIDYRLEQLKLNKVNNINEFNSMTDEVMSHIFVVIDESVDFMKYHKSDEVINKIIDKGVSVGIHLVIATNSYLKEEFEQKTLKKIPYILTYELTSEEESKYIKVEGANLLCEEGEGLIRARDNSIYKINTPYVSDEEISSVVEYIKNNN